MTHTVRAGDTLSGIAQKYGTTVEALVASNGIKDKNLIYVGQVIQIPTKNTDVVKAINDCLEAIEALPEYKRVVNLLYG